MTSPLGQKRAAEGLDVGNENTNARDSKSHKMVSWWQLVYCTSQHYNPYTICFLCRHVVQTVVVAE